MKKIIISCLLFACLVTKINAQDYTFSFQPYGAGGTSWMGTYSAAGYAFERTWFSPGISNLIAISSQENWTWVGGVDPFLHCSPFDAATDGSNLGSEGQAILPISKTLEIINNHPTIEVFIYYFTDDLCEFIDPDIVLSPGQSITVVRGTMDCIAPVDSGLCAPDPVPTLSQWSLIILALALLNLSLVGLKQQVIIPARPAGGLHV